MQRKLAPSEKKFLKPIFRDMLPYGRIVCKVNELDLGGEHNSITPGPNPFFSKLVYCGDFTSAPNRDQWIFVHEMVHVWQYYHDISPVNGFIANLVNSGLKYATSYNYAITGTTKFFDLNIERQASIIADYWLMTAKNLQPLYNVDKTAPISAYLPLIQDFQSAGPPEKPMSVDILGGGKSSW